MKQYAFVDWDLVRSTPMKHTYRCGWLEMILGGKSYRATNCNRRRHLTLEWNGTDQLTVRTGRLLPSKTRWTTDQLNSIAFGLRELESKECVDPSQPGWLWFIHLHGQLDGAGGNHVLAEFLVAHQSDAPATSRARVPARVQELLNWLGHCTGHRVHGPILVTDEVSRRRILSHVDSK